MLRKVIATILAIVMLSSCGTLEAACFLLSAGSRLLIATAAAEEVSAVSTASDFVISEDGTLIKYTGTAAEVIIPSSVKKIGDSVFAGKTTLTKIVIPEGVTAIGTSDCTLNSYGAFYNCDRLTTVTLPSTLTSIGNYAFYSCDGLSSITIPDAVTIIGKSAFQSCNTLTSVTLSKSLKTIGSYAFSSSPITILTMPDGMTDLSDVGDHAFSSTKITDLAIPDSVTALSSSALPSTIVNFTWPAGIPVVPDCFFANKTALETVVFPEGVTAIGTSDCTQSNYGAFFSCDRLTTVTLPSTLTSIGNYAFFSCDGLSSITIPDAVTIIGKSAFQSCKTLTSVTLSKSLKTIGSSAFSSSPITTLTMPDGMTDLSDIGDYAFSSTKITDLAIPDSVTALSSSALPSTIVNFTWPAGIPVVPDCFFANKTALETVVIPEGVTAIGTSDCSYYSNGAFYNCEKLTTVTLPSTLTSIGDYAFYACDGLSSITIPDAVTIIGKSAFYNCKTLTYVTLSKSLKTIGSSAFEYSPITTLTMPEGMTDLSDIGDYAFFSTKITDLAIPDSVTALSSSALPSSIVNFTWPAGVPVVPDCFFANKTALETVVFPEGVTAIGTSDCTSNNYGAFYNCDRLTTVTLPSTLTSIGNYAFYGCDGLSSITIPDAVTIIGKSAFYSCKTLTSVTLSKSLKTIGSSAFEYSPITTLAMPEGMTDLSNIGDYAFSRTKITDLAIPDSVTALSSSVLPSTIVNFTWPAGVPVVPDCFFANKTALETVVFPEGVTAIGTSDCTISNYGAFYNCDRLTTVTLPSTLTSIGNYAFYECGGLSSITIPDAVTIIGDYAFTGTKITDLAIPDGVTALSSSVLPSTIVNFTWPAGIPVVPDCFFANKTALETVIFPEGVTAIGTSDCTPSNYGAFYNCDKLTTVTLPSTLTSIGDYAFNDCDGLPSITIPDAVTIIGKSAFYSCNTLTAVTLSKSLKTIGSSAFEYSPITTLTMPESMTDLSDIGDYAFSRTKITDLAIPDSVTALSSSVLPSTIVNFTWPAGIPVVPDRFFANKTALETVVFPEGVTAIGTSDCSYYYNGAFYNCGKLTTVTLPSTLTSIGNYAFNGTAITIFELPDALASIGTQALPSGLTHMRWPSSMPVVPDGTFSSFKKIQSVVFAEGVTSIGTLDCSSRSNGVFAYCSDLASVQLPSTLHTIGSYAFADCKLLTNLKLPDGLATIGSYALHNTSVSELTLPESLGFLGKEALPSTLYHLVWSSCLAEITSEQLPASAPLETVILPEGVSSIGPGTFSRYPTLQSVTLPYSIASIADNAFSGLSDVHFVLKAGSYAQSYADTYNIHYIVSGASLEVFGMDLANYQGLTLSVQQGEFVYEHMLDHEERVTFVGLDQSLPFHISITNEYDDVIYVESNLNLDAQNNSYEIFDALDVTNTTLNLRLEDMSNVAALADIVWHDENNQPYATGNALRNVPLGKKLTAFITIDADTISTYLPPEPLAVTIDGAPYISLSLTKRPTFNLSGQLIGPDQSHVVTAIVSITQAIDQMHVYSNKASAAADGSFVLPVLTGEYSLTISAPGFKARTLTGTVSSTDMNLNQITLEPTNAGMILFAPTFVSAHRKDAAAVQKVLPPDQVDITLLNETTGTPLSFTVYGDTLYIDGDCDENDQLCITVTSPTGAFDPYVETMTAANVMTFAPEIWQRGSMQLSWSRSTNPSTRVIIYDADGMFTKQYITASTSIRTDDLAEGAYTFILMGASEFVPAPDTLDGFKAASLTENTDYLLQRGAVEQGIISTLLFQSVPQLNLDAYYATDPSLTTFTTNKATMQVGEYATLRAKAAFTEEQASSISDVSWKFMLPDSLTYIEGTASVDGYPCTTLVQNGYLVVKYPFAGQLLRLSVIATNGGSCTIPAYLTYTQDGVETTQFICMADLSVEEMTISTPEKTSFTTITVEGYAPAQSIVQIYDNGKLIADHKHSTAGNWAMDVDLVDPYTYTTHMIQAKIVLSIGITLESAINPVLYQYTDDPVRVRSVAMSNYGHENQKVIFSFDDEVRSTPSYNYNPSYCSFQFAIEFAASDTSLIDDVQLDVFFTNGKSTTLDAVYNVETGLWEASAEFLRNYMPNNVAVRYNHNTDLVFSREQVEATLAVQEQVDDLKQQYGELSLQKIDLSWLTDLDEELLAAVDAYNKAVDDYYAFAEAYYAAFKETYANISFDASGNMVINGSAGPQKVYMDTAEGLTAEGLLAEGYQIFSASQGTGIYGKFDESTNVFSFVDFEQNLAMRTSEGAMRNMLAISRAANNSVGFNSDYLDPTGMSIDTYNLAVNSAAAITEEIFTNRINKSKPELKRLTALKETYLIEGIEWDLEDELLKHQNNVNNLPKEVNKLQVAGKVLGVVGLGLDVKNHYDLSKEIKEAETQLAALQPGSPEYAQAKKLLDLLRQKQIIAGLGTAINAVSTLSMFVPGIGAVGAAVGIGASLVTTCATWYMDYQIEKEKEQLNNLTNQKTPAHSNGNSTNSTPIVDPSGYVYEGVPSNRLKDVVVSVYEKRTEYDIYEDPYEVISLWNAAEFGQVNPQRTDTEGVYGWDVPDGYWQVRAVHPGYEDYATEWMIVPPERKDVYIGMTSYAAPVVQAASATTAGVKLVFSKYVKAETISSGAITIIRNGQPLTGTVTLLNGESNPKNTAETLVSEVLFRPDLPLALEDTLLIDVQPVVQSYAGTTMETAYSANVIVMEPQSLVAPETLVIKPGKASTFTICAEPAEVTQGMTVTVACASSSLEISSSSVTLDANGLAQLEVNTCSNEENVLLTYTLEGTALTAQTNVIVTQSNLAFVQPEIHLFLNQQGIATQQRAVLLTEGIDNNQIIWTSADPSIASVDNGLVTALAEGETTLKASFGLISTECKVHVSRIQMMTLPSALTEIGQSAFAGATAEGILLGEHVTTIGKQAFANCDSLLLISLPATTSRIASDAFKGCPSLTIAAPEDSYAHRYAEDHQIPFIATPR